MPADEGQSEPLAERVVKEAVTLGLETPMREPILEAIDEAGEGKQDPSRTVPMAGALLGLGAAAGYLLGTKGGELDADDVPLDDLEEPDVIGDVVGGEDPEDVEDDVDEADDADDEELEDEGSSGSRLRPFLVGLSLIAAVALLRRKLQSGDDEWEPIEEFETDDDDEAFGGGFEDDDDDEDEDEDAVDVEADVEDEDDDEEEDAAEVEEEAE